MPNLGFGARDITPPAGARFGGYALERTAVAEGAHDRLLASAFAWSNQAGDTAIVVACDLQLVTPDLAQAAREEIEAETEVAGDNIVIHATHNHAAPGGDASETAIPGADPPFATDEVFALVLDGIVGAALEAHARRKRAYMMCYEGMIPGIARRRHDPTQPLQAPARLLIARSVTDGEPIGAVVQYACHPSVLGPENRLFTADFPGVTRAEISFRLDRAPVIYLNGAAADLSTRHTRRESSFAEMYRLGAELANMIWSLTTDADRATECLSEHFGGVCRTVNIALASPVAEADLRRRLELTTRQALDQGREPATDIAVRRARFAIERARRLAQAGLLVPAELQMLRLGELTFLGVGAELASEFGALLDQACPGPLFTLAPANGVVGAALPSHLAAKGGTPLAIGAAEQLVDAAIALLSSR